MRDRVDTSLQPPLVMTILNNFKNSPGDAIHVYVIQDSLALRVFGNVNL
jgi:hypothetical protein